MKIFSYNFFKVFYGVVFKILCRFEVLGKDRVPVRGGVIVASNHASYLDPLVIGAALKRRATFMAREDLFSLPFVGRFVSSFSFPVRRGRPQPSTIKEAVSRLKAGELIVMFPEGGRSSDGGLLDAKRGVGMIAALSGSTVVPAFIEGTERALPVGARFIKPAKIKVFFGNAIEIKPGETGKEFQERIPGDIMEAIGNLRRAGGRAAFAPVKYSQGN